MSLTFGAHSALNVRRILGIAVLATLGVALLVAGGHDPTPAHAATGPCAWTKHTKRVVKHVKRHGKRKKIVRHKAYWTCEPAATAPAPTTAEPTMTMPMPSTPAPPVVEEAPEPEANALGVAAEDQGGFRYTLSRQTVKAGTLIVQLNNRGEDPHALDMQRINADEEPEGPILTELSTPPGDQQTETITVEPGTYRLWCPIGKHAMDGMETTITVVE